MTAGEVAALKRKLTPRTNKYVSIQWGNKKQIAFLLLDEVYEVLYGGSAGGGKSSGLLAAAAQYVDVPGYSAIIFRKKFSDLSLPGALIARSHEWWDTSDAKWIDKDHKWVFPSGATVQFGYMEHDGDEFRYQSAEFQFVGFDELTQIKEHQYLYMFSRMRRLEGVQVPLRMRGATNPGGVGHEWVKKRWNLPYGPGPESPNRVFLNATRHDNPYLDHETYETGLSELNAIQYAQLARGDWDATGSGGVFDPSWFELVRPEDLPAPKFRSPTVRHWDFGSSDKTSETPNPDRSAGAKVGKLYTLPASIAESYNRRGIPLPTPPFWVIYDVVATEDLGNPAAVEDLVVQTASRDGMHVAQSIEQERGASGKHTIHAYRKWVLPGFRILSLWAAGSKLDRAKVVAQMAGNHKVFIVDGGWNESFLHEAGAFGIKGVHDDRVDSVSGAFHQLERMELLENDNEVEQEYSGRRDR